MTDELRKIYAKRISQASRTELIVIMFDMFNDYIKDAKKASQDGDVEKMRKNIRYKHKTHVNISVYKQRTSKSRHTCRREQDRRTKQYDVKTSKCIQRDW